MLAAYITEPGPADHIVIGDLPKPVRGPTDVLIKVSASAVNQVDTYIRSGAYRTPLPTPFVIGRDAIGTVVEASPHAPVRVGERVWCNSLGHAGRQGSFSEYAAVSTDRLYPAPPGASAADLVAAVHPAATAYLGLHEHARVRAGQTVVISGAAGAVGSAAVQLATDAGLRVVATASAADLQFVLGLGADAVVDYRADDVVDQVRQATGGSADVFWDTSGNARISEWQGVVADGGTILTTAGRRPEQIELWPLYTRNIRIVGFVISLATIDALQRAAMAINRRFEQDGFAMRIAEQLPLSAAQDAHLRVEQKTAAGRVVVDLD